jgi:AhpD family alkylhydroperoxidase
MMDERTRELAAIAAAVAGKCPPCFAYHFKQAQQLGVPQAQIDDAVQLAKNIRAAGDKHMDEFAKHRINGTEETK